MKQPPTQNSFMTISDLYEIYKSHPSVQTDTRQLQKGDLYFALKGPNFNGNEFAEKALTLGAAYSIVDEPINTTVELQERIILVEDVLTTLQSTCKISSSTIFHSFYCHHW